MRHFRFPKRWLNRCSTCGYTWYPKGHARSMRCPGCGSGNVTLAPLGCGGCLKGCGWLFIIGFVLSVLSRGCSSSTPTISPASNGTPFPTATPYISSDSAYTPYAASPTATPEVRRALPASTPPAGLSANTDSPPPITPPGGYVVTGVARNDTLNVRSGPGSNYSVVARLPNGCGGIQTVGAPVMNGPTEWVRIEFGSHQAGWVTPNFLKPQ